MSNIVKTKMFKNIKRMKTKVKNTESIQHLKCFNLLKNKSRKVHIIDVAESITTQTMK